MNNSLLLVVIAAVSVLALMLLYRLVRIGYERVLYKEFLPRALPPSNQAQDTTNVPKPSILNPYCEATNVFVL